MKEKDKNMDHKAHLRIGDDLVLGLDLLPETLLLVGSNFLVEQVTRLIDIWVAEHGGGVPEFRQAVDGFVVCRHDGRFVLVGFERVRGEEDFELDA